MKPGMTRLSSANHKSTTRLEKDILNMALVIGLVLDKHTYNKKDMSIYRVSGGTCSFIIRMPWNSFQCKRRHIMFYQDKNMTLEILQQCESPQHVLVKALRGCCLCTPP